MTAHRNPLLLGILLFAGVALAAPRVLADEPEVPAAPVDATTSDDAPPPSVDTAPELVVDTEAFVDETAPPPADDESAVDTGDEQPAARDLEPVRVELIVDPEADLLHASCVRLLAEGQDEKARACFDTVKTTAAQSTAALRADAGLSVLDAKTTAVVDDKGAFMKPGRLELASLIGAYGVWTGVSAGILVGTNSEQYGWGVEPSWLIFGTGVSAVGMGLLYATGGYFMADAMDINQGNAWSTTAGLFWGTTWGIATVFIEMEQFEPNPNWSDESIVFTLLGAGTIGGLSGFGLSLLIEPEIEEVSMMNTGGWVGGFTGILLGMNLGVWSESQDIALLVGGSFMAGNAAGLLLGAGAAHLFDLTWGETLLGDLGAVLGIVGAGSIAFAVVLADPAEGVYHSVFGPRADYGKASITTVSIAAVGGAGAGVALTSVGLGLWHHMNDKRLFHPEALPFQLMPGLPVVILDRELKPAVLAPIVAATW